MLRRPMDAIRSRMIRAVTDRFAGNGAMAARRDHDGEPWLPPDSPARRVHGDIAMLIGGMRALLLQSLHPVAMQAVVDHSGYRSDPWGRLQRTTAFISATTFGSVDQAQGQIDLVRRIHDRVTGTMPDGRPYHAGDPSLLMWIHVAEVDSFLAANRAYAVDPLTEWEVDRYLADVAPTAEALGVIDAPRTEDRLRTLLASYSPVLRASPGALEAARMGLWDPPITGAARLGYRVLAAGAVAILPPWARAELGLPTSVVLDRALLRPSARTLLITLDRAFASQGYRRSSESASTP